MWQLNTVSTMTVFTDRFVRPRNLIQNQAYSGFLKFKKFKKIQKIKQKKLVYRHMNDADPYVRKR